MTPFIVTGLGYGDEGKGGVVDFLVRHCSLNLVIRHNGGAQAAHNVWTDDGRHHTFAQFGSGTFVPGVKTLLSQFMLVNPAAMLNEETRLRCVGVTDAFSRTYIDCRALVTTPWHLVLNRLKEDERGDQRHGSCGMGIGETVEDSLARPGEALTVGDLLTDNLLSKLVHAKRSLCARYPRFSSILEHTEVDLVLRRMLEFGLLANIVNSAEAKLLIKTNACVFEGAQGALLDEDFGAQPHTTWSKTTDANALKLLQEAEVREKPLHIGVTRWYMTRHGAGPFPTEDENLRYLVADDDNGTGQYQGQFRVGRMNMDQLRYAISVNGCVDYLAVTHLDKVIKVVGDTMLERLQTHLQVPVGIISRGKTATSKQFDFFKTAIGAPDCG